MNRIDLQRQGWKAMQLDGFSGVLGDTWVSPDAANPTLGFLAEESHANRHMGTVHGGLLTTFADIALGYAVVTATGRMNMATVQLQMHFVASPQIGEFISCKPEVVRRTRNLAFVRGLIMADDRVVAQSDGIWKIFDAE